MKDTEIVIPPGLSPSEAAVLYVLERIRRDADLRWHMLHTEAMRRLCAAEAARTGQALEAVAETYAAPLTQDEPRLVVARARLQDIERLASEALAVLRRVQQMADRLAGQI
jgi:hypothetical protein